MKRLTRFRKRPAPPESIPVSDEVYFPEIPRTEESESEQQAELYSPDRPPSFQDSGYGQSSTAARSRNSSSKYGRRSRDGLRPDSSLLWNALSAQERPPRTMLLTLTDKLRDQLIEWPLDGNHYFLPINVLDDLITEKSVKEELITLKFSVQGHILNNYVKSICTSAKKLFVLLLLRGQERSIFGFLDEGIDDSDLPFGRCYQQKSSDLPSTFTLCRKAHTSAPIIDHSNCGIQTVAPWGLNVVIDVCAHQWEVQAPVFEKSKEGDIPHLELDDNTVLPFIEDHEAKVVHTKSGGYSHVWGVRIHPAHQKIYRSADPRVTVPLLAVKRLSLIASHDFKNERDMLNSLRVRPHKHLVQLLATYNYRSRYHLIFPYANTNLRGYWHDTGVPYWNRETYLWFLRQVSGIASGLNAIHNLKTVVPLGSKDINPLRLSVNGQLLVGKREERFGRHGNIKPENILWYNELEGTSKEGVLQITDLESVRSHHMEVRSYVDPHHLSSSHTYAAPEVQLMGLVSRSYDIWSLGCVYLEFISWLLEGASGTEQFSAFRRPTELDGLNDDAFYSIKSDQDGEKKAFIRQGVKDWIDRLRKHERCSLMVAGLLMLVQSHLLVIDSGARVKAEALDIELKKILERAEVDKYYLLGKNALVIDLDAGVKIPIGEHTKYGGSPSQAMEPDIKVQEVNVYEADAARDIPGDIPDIRVLDDTLPLSHMSLHKSASWPLDRSKSAMLPYSAMPHSFVTQRGQVTDDLVNDLVRIVQVYNPDETTVNHILKVIPNLLETFAHKMAYKTQNATHHDISVSIYNQRWKLQELFGERYKLISDEEGVEPSYSNTLWKDQLSIDRFLSESVVEDISLATTQIDVYDDQRGNQYLENEDTKESGSQVYQALINTSAYKWLVATLVSETRSRKATSGVVQMIRDSILRALPSSYELNRRSPPPEYLTVFVLDWDPLEFVERQKYDYAPEIALERAIVLVGSANDAQAMTTREYLIQTWPATGRYIMRLITEVVSNNLHDNASITFPDGTELRARIENQRFEVTAIGLRQSLAEIGEQLVWVGSALRPSPYKTGVAACAPFIRSIPPRDESAPEVRFVIKFKMRRLIVSSESPPGQCWHSIFKNPVIVLGYPILIKHDLESGLEISLQMISELLESWRVTEFDGKLFIKGFSEMVIATRTYKDSILWHYVYNTQGERISYLDHHVSNVDKISLHELDSARHVLGWSPDCNFYTGTKDAIYNINEAQLPLTSGGCILEKVSINAGKFVSVGATIAIGTKDVPPQRVHNSYIPQLQYLETKYILLWDEGQKRGWLINGTSALLHLVRASLEKYESDSFSSNFMFRSSKLIDTADNGPNSAIAVLIEGRNRELAIYAGSNEDIDEEELKQKGNVIEKSIARKKKRGYYLFQDLVEQHSNTLQIMIEYQSRLSRQNGVKLKVTVRPRLEGWDFADVFKSRDLLPRVTSLDCLAWGWVDFIRHIDTVTLFGRDFGDLIQPKEFLDICPKWRRLPSGKYYLAASVIDLNRIMEAHGNKWAQPPRLIRELRWHYPAAKKPSPCLCQENGIDRQTGHDPVVVFLPDIIPNKLKRILSISSPDLSDENGAVVFGHNELCPWRWKMNSDEGIEQWNSNNGRENNSRSLSPGWSRDLASASTSNSSNSHEMPATTDVIPSGSSFQTSPDGSANQSTLSPQASDMGPQSNGKAPERIELQTLVVEQHPADRVSRRQLIPVITDTDSEFQKRSSKASRSLLHSFKRILTLRRRKSA